MVSVCVVLVNNFRFKNTTAAEYLWHVSKTKRVFIKTLAHFHLFKIYKRLMENQQNGIRCRVSAISALFEEILFAIF